MSKNNNQWRQEQGHLPEFLKDFHDAKALFRTLSVFFENSDECPISWVDGHVFTIDYFLWFMAIHGYKLTKTRADVEVDCIHETIKEFDPRNQARLANLINGKDA